MYTHIILPTDGSEVATRALDSGIALAKRLDAKVTIVTVVQHSEQRQEAQEALAAAGAKAEAQGVPATMLTRTGDPAEAIMAAANEVGGDLIVMATHGRRGLAAVLLGSQTQHVISHAKVPVLIVR